MVHRKAIPEWSDGALPRRSFIAQAGALGAAIAAGPAAAQFRVDVSGLGAAKLPIAVPDFRGEATGPQQISQIVRADLERSGMFAVVDARGTVVDAGTRPEAGFWRARGADFVVTGQVTPLTNGQYDIRFSLWDTVRAQEIGSQVYRQRPDAMRRAAHLMADFVYEKLIGDKSVFATRIAYVTKAASRYKLWVADSDGENAEAAFSSPEPFISPSWSRDGRHLAYVSFEEGRPIIFAHEVATGNRSVVASFQGSNSAPAWSSNGRQIIATLSRDGGSQIYAMDFPGGREARRLTRSNSIDTEPTCTADGRWIYFVSDRRGGPQIYRMPSGGGLPELVTTKSGSYNISPAISPDGKLMAYIAGTGQGYKLHLMDLAAGAGRGEPMTDTNADESPSFSPNGRLILYATVNQGREALMTVTLDRKTSALAGQGGDIREPDWGPFLP